MNDFNSSDVIDKISSTAGVVDVSIENIKDQFAQLFKIIKKQELELIRLRRSLGE